jgi:hypothetical protein
MHRLAGRIREHDTNREDPLENSHLPRNSRSFIALGIVDYMGIKLSISISGIDGPKYQELCWQGFMDNIATETDRNR